MLYNANIKAMFFKAIIILHGPMLIVYHVLYILHQMDENKNT